MFSTLSEGRVQKPFFSLYFKIIMSELKNLYELAREALDKMSMNEFAREAVDQMAINASSGEGSQLAGRYYGGLFEAGSEDIVGKVADLIIDAVSKEEATEVAKEEVAKNVSRKVNLLLLIKCSCTLNSVFVEIVTTKQTM